MSVRFPRTVGIGIFDGAIPVDVDESSVNVDSEWTSACMRRGGMAPGRVGRRWVGPSAAATRKPNEFAFSPQRRPTELLPYDSSFASERTQHGKARHFVHTKITKEVGRLIHRSE